jgi:hypothetical protein
MGWTDVSLNQQAMLCEKYSGKSTIGFAHSAYAFGALIGVLFGGIMVQFQIPVLFIFISFSVIMVIPTLSMVHQLFDFNEEKSIENSSISDIRIINPIQDNKAIITDKDIEMHGDSTLIAHELPQKKNFLKLFNSNEYKLTNNIQDVEDNISVSSVKYGNNKMISPSWI